MGGGGGDDDSIWRGWFRGTLSRRVVESGTVQMRKSTEHDYVGKTNSREMIGG